MKYFIYIFVVILSLNIGCKKEDFEPINEIVENKVITPTVIKTGFNMDTLWFNKRFPKYTLVTHRWYGHGDFNKDGTKDLVVMFAGLGSENYLFQQNSTDRRVIGVFLNKKTHFDLDTNLVYSYFGGYNGVNVSDMNNDGFLDIYQMTGMWEGTQFAKPPHYNNNGMGGMDSFVFMNNKNKGFTKYTIPIEDNPPTITSIIADVDKDGLKEIYNQSCDYYYEFNGNGFTKNKLNLINTFQGKSYNIRVVTPRLWDSNLGLYYIASDDFTDDYFILKMEGGNLVPKVKYTVPYTKSGFTEGNNGERDEMYIVDLDKDGKQEYIIPSQMFDVPNNPYILIVNEEGKDVTGQFFDSSINTKLTNEQFNGGITNINGFFYHTFADIDGDGIKEIFPSSGLGYLKDGKSHYYKFTEGRFRLSLYHNSWFGGGLNTVEKRGDQHGVFADEKNRVNVLLVWEGNLGKSKIISF